MSDPRPFSRYPTRRAMTLAATLLTAWALESTGCSAPRTDASSQPELPPHSATKNVSAQWLANALPLSKPFQFSPSPLPSPAWRLSSWESVTGTRPAGTEPAHTSEVRRSFTVQADPKSRATPCDPVALAISQTAMNALPDTGGWTQSRASLLDGIRFERGPCGEETVRMAIPDNPSNRIQGRHVALGLIPLTQRLPSTAFTPGASWEWQTSLAPPDEETLLPRGSFTVRGTITCPNRRTQCLVVEGILKVSGEATGAPRADAKSADSLFVKGSGKSVTLVPLDGAGLPLAGHLTLDIESRLESGDSAIEPIVLKRRIAMELTPFETDAN